MCYHCNYFNFHNLHFVNVACQPMKWFGVKCDKRFKKLRDILKRDIKNKKSHNLRIVPQATAVLRILGRSLWW